LFVVPPYMHRALSQKLVEQLQSTDPAKVAAALASLPEVSAKSRRSILGDEGVRSNLRSYFDQRAQLAFNVAAGRYDLAGARAAIGQAQSLYPDSEKLTEDMEALESAHKAEIARQAERFETQLKQGLLIPSQGRDNVQDTLNIIAQLDRSHPLLNDPRLPIAFAGQSAAALTAGKLDLASELLAAGLRLAPNDASLRDLQDRYGQQRKPPSPQVDQLHAALSKMAAAPQSDEAWVTEAKRTLQTLETVAGKGDPAVSAARATISGAFLTQSGALLADHRLTEAQRVLDLARDFGLSADRYKVQADAVAHARAQLDENSNHATAACRASLAGRGQDLSSSCRDRITAGGDGPDLVVIPAGQGLNSFAIERDEVSIAEYSAYCRAAHCAAPRGAMPEVPMTSVSVADADRYAAWLSAATGAKYRLPSEQEWRRAAAQFQDPAANCLVVINGQIVRGASLRPVNMGNLNAFGLRHVVGNAQEWAKSDSGGWKALGGAIGDPLAICSTQLARPHSGSPDGRTGFRLVREMR